MNNNKLSNAKSFFDMINNMKNDERLKYLKDIINEENKFYEADWIDFKGGDNLKINNMKKIWKTIIVIIIILLFLGVVISIALGNIDNIDILKKIP